MVPSRGNIEVREAVGAWIEARRFCISWQMVLDVLSSEL
jgi:hypothetical protein